MAAETQVPQATRTQAPYRAQNAHENLQLVQSLEKNQKSGRRGKRAGFSCKKTTFAIPQANGLEIDSWKLDDWDYKRDDLPTYARGLFTYKTSNGTNEIAIRGYDKFFNIEEVNDTKWANIEAKTRGPYELSNKENGCIIFISGLVDDVILVCSKHSTGARQDASASHAVNGERWIEKHLATVGKSKAELACELRKRNVTLVAELCDDTFEEHVLEYGPEVAGLYVHGINLNLPEFATYPGHLVQQFADEWGMKKAKYVVMDDIESSKSFLEKCGESGSWSGRDTEGFVVRCQKKEAGGWVDWFFKYKFEEPYLMYRQWREATKAVIAGRSPRVRKHKKITEEYLLYARRQLAKNPQLGKDYKANHGIIAMRDGFLAERGVDGAAVAKQDDNLEDGEISNDSTTRSVSKNVVLVPISTIGCGKTTIANALTYLYGWGHVQNDNITGQKGRPRQFALQLTNNLSEHPVVIADRNNHQKRERAQIFEDVSKVIPDAKYVALHYVHDPKSEMVPQVRAVTTERVLGRGDNHQTIRASSKDKSEILGIVDGFLARFEPINTNLNPDDKFDLIIDIDPRESSRHNLDLVIKAMHENFPKLVPENPAVEDVDKAIESALYGYTVGLKHDLSFQSKNKHKGKTDRDWRQSSGDGPVLVRNNGASNKAAAKPPKLEYIAVKLSTNSILETLKDTFGGLDAGTSHFYHHLQQSRRMQPNFHVTLMHRASQADNPGLWRSLEERYQKAVDAETTADPLLGKCDVRLASVVWDDRVMCIAAELIGDWVCANAVPHVTVGTANASIKPRESNDLLIPWSMGEEGRFQEVKIKDGSVTVSGEVRAVTAATR